MTKQGVHRVSPDSKRGRQMQLIGRTVRSVASQEIVQHNADVEEKRKKKLADKLAKRNLMDTTT